jgi:hypothetical protein
MKKPTILLAAHSLYLIVVMPLFGQGFVASSLEQYNYQVGDDLLTLRSYDGFDDIDGFDDVTGLSLSINGAPPENIPFNPFYEAFKRGINYETLEDMLADRPIDGSYTHNLTGTPSGSVAITAPGIPYANGIPVNPVFTITGASGTWGRGPEGIGRFYFNPDSTTSFTVTMNAYAVTTQGGHYAYGVFVADITSGFNSIDEYSSDLVVAGETPPVPANLTLTFTKGLGLDADDDDPTTFGFSAGTKFELEGEHVNIFGLSDAGLGPDVGLKAFPYQTVTAFELVAEADPLSLLPLATGIEVTEVSSSGNTFYLDWQTTPADAPVDVYRSENLVSWGSPVSEINQAGFYSEPITPGSKAFFVVVPAGTPNSLAP